MDIGQATILNSLNEGVFTVDLNWKIRTFNRAAVNITGVPEDEAIGRRCHEVFRSDSCENGCPLRAAFERNQPVFNATAHIISTEGRSVPIRISAALLRNESGEIIGGVETFQDTSQICELQKQLNQQYSFQDIVGRSPAMQRLFELLPTIARSPSTVLIEGESGTGKELVARALHQLSPRQKKPFVAVNCAALPDTLLESELFGYKKGAFTGAQQTKPGRFSLADKGTLFLDEIGDISAAMQVRLLRVIQERIIEPLGSVQPEKVDVRIVAATNKSLSELVSGGTFREDLFYRIRVVHLKIPPLRERKEDIPLLINAFIERFNHLQNRSVAGMDPDAVACLLKHPFPGNIRELENIIEQAFVLCQEDWIRINHLPEELQPQSPVSTFTTSMTLQELEKTTIESSLRRHDGNRQRSADELGINVSTLFRKIREYAINIPAQDGRGKRRK